MTPEQEKARREAARMKAEAARKKAEAMRWRKPVHDELHWENIEYRVSELMDECANVRWMAEDEELLLEALDGDDEAVYEFKIAFSDLASECERMSEELEELRRYQQAYDIGTDEDGEDAPALFDLFFAASDQGGNLYGYDEYVEDYMPIQHFSQDYAREKAAERLKRLTKDQLIQCAGVCIDVARNFMALTNRYDHLSGALDILRGQNEGYLQMVKLLEEAYDRAEAESDGFKYKFQQAVSDFDRLLSELPERIWLE